MVGSVALRRRTEFVRRAAVMLVLSSLVVTLLAPLSSQATDTGSTTGTATTAASTATIDVRAVAVNGLGAWADLGTLTVNPGDLDSTTLHVDGYSLKDVLWRADNDQRLLLSSATLDEADPQTLVLGPVALDEFPDQDLVDLTVPLSTAQLNGGSVEGLHLVAEFVPDADFATVTWNLPQGVTITGDSFTDATHQVIELSPTGDGSTRTARAAFTLRAPVDTAFTVPLGTASNPTVTTGSGWPSGLVSVRLVEDRSTETQQIRSYELTVTGSTQITVTSQTKKVYAEGSSTCSGDSSATGLTFAGEVVTDGTPTWASAPVVKKYWSTRQLTQTTPTITNLCMGENVTVYFDFTGGQVASNGVTSNYFLNAIDVNGDVLVVPDPPVMSAQITDKTLFQNAYKKMRESALGPLAQTSTGAMAYTSRDLVSKTYTQGPNAGTKVTVQLSNIRALSDTWKDPMEVAGPNINTSMTGTDPRSYVYSTRYVVKIERIRQVNTVVRARFLPTSTTSVISMGATGLTLDGTGEAIEVLTTDGYQPLCVPGVGSADCATQFPESALATVDGRDTARVTYAPGYGAPRSGTVCPDGTAATTNGCYGVTADGREMSALYALPAAGQWNLAAATETGTSMSSTGAVSKTFTVPHLGYSEFTVGTARIGAGLVEPLLAMASPLGLRVAYRNDDGSSFTRIADATGVNVRSSRILHVTSVVPNLGEGKTFVGWDLQECSTEDATGATSTAESAGECRTVSQAITPGASIDLLSLGLAWLNADGSQYVKSLRFVPTAAPDLQAPSIYTFDVVNYVDDEQVGEVESYTFRGLKGLGARLSAKGLQRLRSSVVDGVTVDLVDDESAVSEGEPVPVLSTVLGGPGASKLGLFRMTESATLVLHEKWTVNGLDVPVEDAAQWLTGSLTVDGKPVTPEVALTGFRAADTVDVVWEGSVPGALIGCSLRGVSLVPSEGVSATFGESTGTTAQGGTRTFSGTMTLTSGENTGTLTVDLLCAPDLVLPFTGGSARDSWLLVGAGVLVAGAVVAGVLRLRARR